MNISAGTLHFMELNNRIREYASDSDSEIVINDCCGYQFMCVVMQDTEPEYT